VYLAGKSIRQADRRYKKPVLLIKIATTAAVLLYLRAALATAAPLFGYIPPLIAGGRLHSASYLKTAVTFPPHRSPRKRLLKRYSSPLPVGSSAALHNVLIGHGGNPCAKRIDKATLCKRPAGKVFILRKGYQRQNLLSCSSKAL